MHSSPVKSVSEAMFYSAASQFSVTVYESKRAVSTDESICHM
jgi:hypothetical protein